MKPCVIKLKGKRNHSAALRIMKITLCLFHPLLQVDAWNDKIVALLNVYFI